MRISLRSGIATSFVTLVGTLALVACSGAKEEELSNGGETTGEDQSLLKEGACLTETMGGPTSCKPDDLWKKYASESCSSRGLELTELSFGQECKGGHIEAKYACCKTAPKPIPKPEPVACFVDAQGGPTSCKPVEVWTKYASEVCAQKGAKITRIGFAEECAKGSFRWTKYECCDGTKPPPPPPPPPVCKTTELGDGKTCVWNGTWKEKAFNYCNDQKLQLTSLSLGQSCEKDGSTSIKVECCSSDIKPPEPPKPEPKPEPKPDPKPEPPKPSVCETQVMGDPTSCKDPGTWKQYAWEACQKQGANLTELGFGTPCGNNGETREAKFTCCK